MGTERRWICGALLLLLLGASQALAHRGRIVRTLYLEPHGPSQMHLLVHLRMTGSKQRAALLLVSDLNKDGKLSEAERARVEQNLSARALDGLRLFVQGKPVVAPKMKAKLKLPPPKASKAAIELLLHGVVPVPSGAVDLEVRTEPAAEPLGLAYVPGGRPLLEVQPKRGKLKKLLGPGDAVRWRVSAAKAL